MHEGGKKAIIAAFLANLGIAVVKFIAFFVTGAASMLAEAIHSLADTGNQGLLLLGGNRAAQPPDDRHPFGYGRERYFWAFVVAIVLFTIGAVFALFEGYEKVLHPHHLDKPIVAFIVLGIAIVLESFSLRTAVRESRHLKGQQTWRAFIKRTKNPELTTVLLEDIGALLGLVFALVGIALAEITGNARFDAVGSIAIGALLAGIAYILANKNRSLLIGEAADEKQVQNIRSAIEQSEAVDRLIHLRTLQLGPEDLLVTAKVDFANDITMKTLGAAIDAVEARIRLVAPEARLIFIEPDTYRATDASAPTEK
jgi:cation diffusion facilitator family transporter